MKEIIEKKLGMTIEAFLEEQENKLKGPLLETEEWSPLYEMTNEELDYLLEYIEQNGLNNRKAS